MNRSLCDSSALTRLEIAKNLTKLPCLMTRCDKTNCRMHQSPVSFLFSREYHSIAIMLMNGPEDEVTPAVRRETLRALRYVIDHHPVGVSTDGLDDVELFLINYIKDSDRSARLSAW